jgi:hypothetical protein
MKNKLTMMAGVAAALIGFSTTVQANTISGSIGFSGDVTLNGPVGTATQVTQWWDITQTLNTPQVGTRTGDFATYVALGAYVTFATPPWTFNPATAVNAFWTVGGFTFDLTSSSITSQSATSLDVFGYGTVSGNGFDSTPGTWSFTTQDPNNTFTFSSNTRTIPDGGATAMLLGVALSALGLIRRKLVA